MSQEENGHKELTRSDKDMEILDHHVRILRTTFDSVQVFVTRHEEGIKQTINANAGGGNWYARYGNVKSWVIAQDAYTSKAGQEESND